MPDYLFKYKSSDCGSGKTYSLIQEILKSTEKYLIVQGTLKLCEQTTNELGKIARSITSNNSANVYEELVAFLFNNTHRVLVITDVSFLQIKDVTLLSKWKIYLDDVVNFHHFASHNTTQKSIIENKLFHSFERVGDMHVTAKPVIKFGDVVLESASKAFSFVRQYDYFLFNARFFEKVGGTNQYEKEKDQLQVMSWVNLKRFAGLDITFMANDFENTLVYLSSPDTFKRVNTNLRTRSKSLQERMRVFYFSDIPLTKTLRINSPEQFEKVLTWVNTNLSNYIFTINGDQDNTVLNGQYVPPKSRGVNEYSKYNTVVWLASMKPSNIEAKQCKLMFGLTYENLVQSREREELYQFIQRSNLRDYESDEIVDVYVFDKEQALSLSENPVLIDLEIESTNSAKDESTFIPMALSSAENSAYSRITNERYPNKQSFDKFMNKTGQAAMSEDKKKHFERKWLSLHCSPK